MNSQLTDEQIDQLWFEQTIINAPDRRRHMFARAVESVSTISLLQYITELERANQDFSKRQEWWNERMVELEKALEMRLQYSQKLSDIIAKLERKSSQDDETILWQAAEISKHLDRIKELEQAQKPSSQEPFGYFCDWGNDSLGLQRVAMYYSEPGNAIDDDWNEHPKVHKNLPLYTRPKD